MSSKNQNLEDYEVIQQIGKGSFGIVCKIKRKSDGKNLVWKELNYGKMSDREKQQLVAEVNIIRELKHPNIVKYYDRIIDKKNQKIYIIMEYCEGGDMGILLKKCKKDKDYIAEDVIWKIFTQIVIALSECHKRKQGKILHRDLKPANIFLDAQNNIKLGDFGLSKHLSDTSVYTYTHVGTPYYMSPEQINEVKYNEKSDIWSAGCLLYEMAALYPPFQATNHLSLAIKIKAGKFDRLPMRYSEELQNLVSWMITCDQDKRPNIDQILQIPQVALRIRERKLRERHSNVKLRESELKEKEKILNEQDEVLKKKEEELNNLKAQIEQKRKQNQKLNEEYLLKMESQTISQQIKEQQNQIFTRFKNDQIIKDMYDQKQQEKENYNSNNNNNLANLQKQYVYGSSQQENNNNMVKGFCNSNNSSTFSHNQMLTNNNNSQASTRDGLSSYQNSQKPDSNTHFTSIITQTDKSQTITPQQSDILLKNNISSNRQAQHHSLSQNTEIGGTGNGVGVGSGMGLGINGSGNNNNNQYQSEPSEKYAPSLTSESFFSLNQQKQMFFQGQSPTLQNNSNITIKSGMMSINNNNNQTQQTDCSSISSNFQKSNIPKNSSKPYLNYKENENNMNMNNKKQNNNNINQYQTKIQKRNSTRERSVDMTTTNNPKYSSKNNNTQNVNQKFQQYQQTRIQQQQQNPSKQRIRSKGSLHQDTNSILNNYNTNPHNSSQIDIDINNNNSGNFNIDKEYNGYLQRKYNYSKDKNNNNMNGVYQNNFMKENTQPDQYSQASIKSNSLKLKKQLKQNYSNRSSSLLKRNTVNK